MKDRKESTVTPLNTEKYNYVYTYRSLFYRWLLITKYMYDIITKCSNRSILH